MSVEVKRLWPGIELGYEVPSKLGTGKNCEVKIRKSEMRDDDEKSSRKN